MILLAVPQAFLLRSHKAVGCDVEIEMLLLSGYVEIYGVCVVHRDWSCFLIILGSEVEIKLKLF